MDRESLRRLVLNLNAAVILSRATPAAASGAYTQEQVNAAVQASREVEKAVRKRIRWEQWHDKSGRPLPSSRGRSRREADTDRHLPD